MRAAEQGNIQWAIFPWIELNPQHQTRGRIEAIRRKHKNANNNPPAEKVRIKQ